MKSTGKAKAALETLMLISAGNPRHSHFVQVAAQYGWSAKTLRRQYQRLMAVPTGAIGPSAQAAIDSCDGVDPRTLYVTTPEGFGWWPTWDDLQVIAGSPTLAAAHQQLVAAATPGTVPGYEQFTRRLKQCLTPGVYQGLTDTSPNAVEKVQIYATNRRPERMNIVELDCFELPIDVQLPRSTRVVKPWLMVAIDRGTRAVPAWLVMASRPASQDFATLLALMFTGTTTPLLGLVPATCISVTRSRSIWSGRGPDVS